MSISAKGNCDNVHGVVKTDWSFFYVPKTLEWKLFGGYGENSFIFYLGNFALSFFQAG